MSTMTDEATTTGLRVDAIDSQPVNGEVADAMVRSCEIAAGWAQNRAEDARAVRAWLDE